MPSIVPGYEYDIFISYRHKDNKGAQWVSKFVTALRTELESTFKEDVSIYFDTNPQDGILETHNVHDSLSGKLKCVIFIPIISQTYCDPKSFAWQHEFCVFNKLAKSDELGRDIKLRNGNVASRILPVRIHELDAHDLKMLSEELGGPLRSVDFIYREAGVNRPLRSREEHSSATQSKTDYRNQINKVANAIKEIIESIARPGSIVHPNIKPKKSEVSKSGKVKGLVAMLILAVIVAAGYLVYTKVIRRNDTVGSFEKSIAVLPFTDMTPSADMGYLGDGIAEEIINSLASIKSLKVIGRTSSFQFKGENPDLREVGEKLQVGIVLEGSVRKFEDHFRITATLIRTDNNVQIWSEKYDLDQTNLFKIQDNIAANVAERLKLTLSSMEKTTIIKKEIDPEAYTLYLKGLYQYKLFKFADCLDYEQAVLKIDSTYAPAHALIGLSKTWIINSTLTWRDTSAVNSALRSSEQAIKFDPGLAEGYSAIALISWSLQNNFPKARLYFDKSVELNPSSALILNRYAFFLIWMADFQRAETLAKSAMRIDPVDVNSYAILFWTSIHAGRVDDAARYHKDRDRIFGVNRQSLIRQMNLAFAYGDFKKVVAQSDSMKKNDVPLTPDEISYLSASYSKMDQVSESNKAIAELKSKVASGLDNVCFDIALCYAEQQKLDSCFKYLRLSTERHEDHAKLLKISTELAQVRNDPRYQKLYSEGGFDKY